MVVIMVTFVQLWSTTFAATGQSVIDGFSVSDLVWYLVITEVVALSPPRIAQTVDTQVRTGDIAYALARPYSLPLYHVAWYWGDTLVRMPVNALVGGAVAFLAVGPPPTSVGAIFATLVLWIGGITLKALIEMLIGLSAFWVEDTAPIEWIYAKLLYTIGGLLLPLDLFPGWLAAISRSLPFAAIMYAPARAFVDFSWPLFGNHARHPVDMAGRLLVRHPGGVRPRDAAAGGARRLTCEACLRLPRRICASTCWPRWSIGSRSSCRPSA